LTVYTVRNLVSAAFLVTDDRAAMIVDTGVAGRAPAMLKQIRKAGLAPSDIGLIVLTHHHWDHTGSVRELREATGAPVAIHRLDADQLRRGGLVDLQPTGFLPRLMKPWLAKQPIRALEPDIELDDDEDLTAHGGIGRSIWTPGHTPGSISVVLADGTLFTGDAMVESFTRPRVATGPMFAADEGEAAHSLRRIADQEAVVVYTAHGGRLRARSVARFRTR
jgi:hydroxyacylglutathione hydrolase